MKSKPGSTLNPPTTASELLLLSQEWEHRNAEYVKQCVEAVFRPVVRDIYAFYRIEFYATLGITTA